MAELKCPRCGTSVSELQTIDSSLAAKLQEKGITENLPAQVCMNCFSQISGSLNRGSVLQNRERAKEQQKLMLWKSRVNLIKKARQKMTEKSYSEAAVQYEKYIKVLEMVFEVPAGGLTPEAFKDSARTQELTIVAGAYWDMLRIYDTSEAYGERMRSAGEKLALFLKYTPIYPDILRKAEAFAKTAKNPSVVKSFVKSASENKGRCFIATAAFESPSANEVLFLQNWRDEFLLKTKSGRIFVNIYYRLSPAVASFLDSYPQYKPFVRKTLRLFINRALRQ